MRYVETFPIATHEPYIDVPDINAVMFHSILRICRIFAFYGELSINLGPSCCRSCLVDVASWRFSPTWFYWLREDSSFPFVTLYAIVISLVFTITHSAYVALLASSHLPLLVVCFIVAHCNWWIFDTAVS
jgi:hypothetical protein